MGKERFDLLSCLAHCRSASALAPCPPFLDLDPRLSLTFLSSGQAEFSSGYWIERLRYMGELLMFSERDRDDGCHWNPREDVASLLKSLAVAESRV